MKNIDEKEKKLKDTLKKLGEINIQHNEELDKVAILKDQKNQLEIEKKQITTSLQSLEEENLKLRSQINELKKKIRPLRLKLHKTCKHTWIYDECEPFDSRCKYKCKYCHLPRNINYV